MSKFNYLVNTSCAAVRRLNQTQTFILKHVCNHERMNIDVFKEETLSGITVIRNCFPVFIRPNPEVHQG